MSERDNVIDLSARRAEKARADHSGWFADVHDVDGEMLQPLGEGDGPFAVGLMAPLHDREIDDARPQLCGWWLTPAQARELATLLRTYADDCEQGYPTNGDSA